MKDGLKKTTIEIEENLYNDIREFGGNNFTQGVRLLHFKHHYGRYPHFRNGAHVFTYNRLRQNALSFALEHADYIPRDERLELKEKSL